MPDELQHCYSFGPFVVDVKRRLMWRLDVPVPLTAKTFEVMAVLIQKRDRVVEKDELMKLVWPDAIVLESNLVRQMSMLRRALGERPEQHQYIVTIPGRGYQFVAEVQIRAVAPDALPADLPPAVSHDAPASSVTVEPLPVVQEANEPVTTHPLPIAGAGGVQRRSGVKIALLAASVVALTGVGVHFRPQALSRPAAEPTLRQLTFDGGLPREASWAPDGRHLAYVSSRRGNPDVWIQSVESGEPRQLTVWGSAESQPNWSPDGQWIAFRSDHDGGGVYVASATGTTIRRVAPFGDRPRWSPNGRQILFSSTSIRTGARRLYIVDVDNAAEPRPILDTLVKEFVSSDPFASVDAGWFPDGLQVSIWGRSPTDGWVFTTAPIDGRPASTSTISPSIKSKIDAAGITLGHFAWARSRRHIYFEGRSSDMQSVWRVTVDPNTLEWLAGPERVTPGTETASDIALSADESMLAFTVSTARTRLWSMRLDMASRNQALEPVTSGSSGRFGEFAVDAARSGDVLAYRADQGARQELRTYSLSSGLDHTLIADTDVARTIPRWSPDGKMVTYAVFNRSGARGSRAQAVAVLATDGGSERLLTMPGEHRFVPTDWSLGRTIIGSCRYGDPARWGTCTISTSDGPATRGMVRLLSADPSFNLYSQRFSPDQAWISFVGLASEDSARSTIFVSRPDGGDWRPITTGPWYVDKPRWASDSRALYYLSNRGGALNVWKQGFDPAAGALVGAPVEVTNFRDEQRAIPSRNFADIDIAVGGNRLFLPVTETSSAIWILSAVNSR